MKIYYIKAQELKKKRRFDQALAEKLEISRMRVKQLIESGSVLVDGEAVGARVKLEGNEEIEVYMPDPKPMALNPVEMDLKILYEDNDFLALNKNAGVTVHPGAGVRDATLVAGLLHHCQGELSGIGGVERPGIVHRLDRDTSGILIVAKNDQAHLGLSEQFQSRTIQKFYQAFVLKKPPNEKGTWDGSIGRHPVQRHKMSVLKNGRHARTDYCIIEELCRVSHEKSQQSARWATFIELQIHTGRTHQIRVHSAHAGCPVIGDRTYGGNVKWPSELGVQRQLLHASRLHLRHPRTKEELQFVAPLPEDFCSFYEAVSGKKFVYK
ncbi:MAG: RluA family pseudouridine synthase [Verrucomicrobiota bacterium]